MEYTGEVTAVSQVVEWAFGGDLQAGSRRRTLDWEARLICGFDPELEADFRTLVEAQAEASLSVGPSR